MNRIILCCSIVFLAFAPCRTSADDKVDFDSQIQPIFAEHCGQCHGEKKGLGKLRLHNSAAIREKLAADAELLVAGKPEESELYQRLVLPAENRKRMPKGADPLPDAVVALIKAWIEQGAVLSLTAASEPAAAAPTEAPLPEVAAASAEVIQRLTEAGAQVLPLYADSNLLQISYAYRDQPASDADLAMLEDAAEQVYSLNLTGGQISAAGCESLAKCVNLHVLHLEKSTLDDASLAAIGRLSSLEYLNIYATDVTDAGLEQLKALTKLKKLYLWQTKASYEMAMDLEAAIEGLQTNLGYDHPVIVKQRLTKEKEQFTEQLATAKTEVESAEKQLEAAKQRQERLTERLAEVEKSLKELDAPPEGAGEEGATADESAEEGAGEKAPEKKEESQ